MVDGLTVQVGNVDWQSESAEAWDKIRPGIKTQISSLNFLYELREIKRLFDFWSKKRSRLKNLANAHLNYSFGWAPLISDTERILELMVNFNQKWNELVEQANKPIKRHHSRVLSPRSVSTQSANLGASCWDFKAVTTQEEVRYTATVTYRYTIPLQWRGVPARFLGMMDAYGLNLNPSILWNAVPWSFAVDWITTTGSWLESWTQKALTLNVEILDFCHSVSSTASRITTAFDVLPDGILPETVICTSSASHYDRRVAYPGVLSLPRLKTPRWGALFLGGSLGISQTRKRKAPGKARLWVPQRMFVPRRHTGR
jgi:hypothetical protein